MPAKKSSAPKPKTKSKERGKTAGATPKRSSKPAARPRNARKDGIASGDSNDTKGQASYALESTTPGKRPSRKSTRGSSNRAKPDSQLKNRQTRAVRSPQARSQSRAG